MNNNLLLLLNFTIFIFASHMTHAIQESLTNINENKCKINHDKIIAENIKKWCSSKDDHITKFKEIVKLNKERFSDYEKTFGLLSNKKGSKKNFMYKLQCIIFSMVVKCETNLNLLEFFKMDQYSLHNDKGLLAFYLHVKELREYLNFSRNILLRNLDKKNYGLKRYFEGPNFGKIDEFIKSFEKEYPLSLFIDALHDGKKQ